MDIGNLAEVTYMYLQSILYFHENSVDSQKK